MNRVSSSLMTRQAQLNLMRQEGAHARVLNQIGTQQRIQSLRDDPIAAGHLVRYNSFRNRVERFEHNAKTLTEQFTVREGYMQHSVDIMQRVRELAVAGSNGIQGKDDLKNMAGEVDELLHELVLSANAVDQDGNSLFSGTRTKAQAFDIVMGTVPGSLEPVITGVRYNGNIGQNTVEIDEGAYIPVDNCGNKLFWAEPQMLQGQKDATSYQVLSNSQILVDGQKIDINSGDNLYSIVAKINNSGAAVKASIDPITHGLNIVTQDARQLWIEDTKGTVLQDMGIVTGKTQRPPYNMGSSAKVSGASMFDAIIALRDAMLSGDNDAIGGRVLGTIDSGLNNMLTGLSKSGSASERLELAATRNSNTVLNITQMVSSTGDVDYTKAITDMKMMEMVNQATMANTGKLYSSTLLDYMR